MDNKQLWNELSQPPPSALKPIAGGRLQGMTDINPQWRLEVMTQVFGPCGVGWKYSIEKLWTEQGHGEEVIVFAIVSVQIKNGGEWSEPIPGVGGNKLVEQEKRGPHNNDEAYKMAITDALSVALKALGVASDIYAGLWDGSKYRMRPEDVVTPQQHNSLKVKYLKTHEKRLEEMNRDEKLRDFSDWCRDICGADVDYNAPESWHREWYEKCWKSLTGHDSDVPFE